MLLFIYVFMYQYLDRVEGRERGQRKREMLERHIDGLHPTYAQIGTREWTCPWLGIELETFRCMGWCSDALTTEHWPGQHLFLIIHLIQASVFTYVRKLRQSTFTVVFSNVVKSCLRDVVSQKHPFQIFLFMARSSEATKELQILTKNKLPVNFVIK